MPRGVLLDLSAPDALDIVNTLPSPPPVYSQLPIQLVETTSENISNVSDEDESISDDDSEILFDENDELSHEHAYEEGEGDEHAAATRNQLVNDQDWEVSETLAIQAIYTRDRKLNAFVLPLP